VGRWKVNKTEEKPLGRVTHYYSHLGVIIIELTSGELNTSEQDFSKFGPWSIETALTFTGGLIMPVKILIQRKIKPGKEKELSKVVNELRSKAMHAQGFISGETLQSIEDPALYLVISAWKSLEDWKSWVDTQERKALEQEIETILAEPAKMSPYQIVTYFDLQAIVENMTDEITVSE
jgi:heme-degrading monooxygenase HmoA